MTTNQTPSAAAITLLTEAAHRPLTFHGHRVSLNRARHSLIATRKLLADLDDPRSLQFSKINVGMPFPRTNPPDIEQYSMTVGPNLVENSLQDLLQQIPELAHTPPPPPADSDDLRRVLTDLSRSTTPDFSTSALEITDE